MVEGLGVGVSDEVIERSVQHEPLEEGLLQGGEVQPVLIVTAFTSS